jgi:hypothetical protein
MGILLLRLAYLFESQVFFAINRNNRVASKF